MNAEFADLGAPRVGCVLAAGVGAFVLASQVWKRIEADLHVDPWVDDFLNTGPIVTWDQC